MLKRRVYFVPIEKNDPITVEEFFKKYDIDLNEEGLVLAMTGGTYQMGEMATRLPINYQKHRKKSLYKFSQSIEQAFNKIKQNKDYIKCYQYFSLELQQKLEKRHKAVLDEALKIYNNMLKNSTKDSQKSNKFKLSDQYPGSPYQPQKTGLDEETMINNGLVIGLY